MSEPSRRTPALPRIVQPLQDFLSTETAGGVLLLAATVTALVWANAPFGDSYGDFWGAHLRIDLNRLDLDLALVQWVNDGLMAIFFFVVGLEIKREVLRGELADRRKAALPVAAAIGGMALPAAIYLAFNLGGRGEHGWGIPMATDIAFAVGVLSLLGARVPLSLKVFLLALAIADDLGAIAVIALFYSDGIDFGWLAAATAIFAVTFALGRLRVRPVILYVALGAAAWIAMHESGVHATIAGVVLGLLTPADPHYDRDELEASAASLIGDYAQSRDAASREGRELSRSALRGLEDLSRGTRAPIERLEHTLHPWSSYAIVPVFALANAGIALDGGALRDGAFSPITAGVICGLIFGKPLGILLFAWIAVRSGIAALPEDVGWPALASVAVVAGIGFTVSLFIGDLAFHDAALQQEAKIGVLAGSAVMGLAGLAALLLMSRRRDATSPH